MVLFLSLSTNSIGEYWSCISPSMSMIVMGHWLLYKDITWCCLVYDVYRLPMIVVYRDRNTWNTFPGSELNIYRIIRILNSRIKHWITEMDSNNKSWTINNWQRAIIMTSWLKWVCHSKGWNMIVKHLHRVKYLCDYGTDNYNPVLPRY